MTARSFLTYRNLGFITLVLGALTHAQAQNSSAAALVNKTDRTFRIDVSTFGLYPYDPTGQAPPASAIEGRSPELDGRNVSTRTPALRLGQGVPAMTSAILRPGEILEFTGRPGFNTLQTVDLTIREASAESTLGPGAAGLFLYWSWETEILPDGMVTSGGARGINPPGPATFFLEGFANGRAVAIVSGPSKPAGPMGGLPEPKDLLPEPMGHAERNLPPEMVKILDDKNGGSSSSTSSTSSSSSTTTTTSSSSSSSSSSSTTQPDHAVPPGGL